MYGNCLQTTYVSTWMQRTQQTRFHSASHFVNIARRAKVRSATSRSGPLSENRVPRLGAGGGNEKASASRLY